MTGRVCRKCGGTERYADGRCAACVRETARKRHEVNPEIERERKRRRYEANPEKYREASRVRSRRWIAANPEKHREAQRKRREANPEKYREADRKRREANPEKRREYARLRKYGLRAEEVQVRREAQNNACAICRREFTGEPHVDHDHRSGAVRALLCGSCNRGLGLFGDNPARLDTAAAYLRHHSQAQITR